MINGLVHYFRNFFFSLFFLRFLHLCSIFHCWDGGCLAPSLRSHYGSVLYPPVEYFNSPFFRHLPNLVASLSDWGEVHREGHWFSLYGYLRGVFLTIAANGVHGEIFLFYRFLIRENFLSLNWISWISCIRRNSTPLLSVVPVFREYP